MQVQSPAKSIPLAFSVPEFCDWAGIGRTKVYEEIEAQRLPVVKVGKRTLIRLYDARAWLQSLPSSRPQSSPAQS